MKSSTVALQLVIYSDFNKRLLQVCVGGGKCTYLEAISMFKWGPNTSESTSY